jgi:hypothetical protein
VYLSHSRLLTLSFLCFSNWIPLFIITLIYMWLPVNLGVIEVCASSAPPSPAVNVTPPSGLMRSAACAPKPWTTPRSAPKVTRWCPSPPAEAVVLQRSASCAASATRMRRASRLRCGWCAACQGAAQETPCATALSTRCIKRLPMSQQVKIFPLR